MEHAGEFVHGYTYSGHPLACAAGLVNLRILQEEDLPGKAGRETGPYLKKLWEGLETHLLVGEARMTGLVGAFEIVADKQTMARFPSDAAAGPNCRDLSITSGLVMRAVSDTMIISPPLILSKDECDTLVATARTALDQLAERLG